MQHSNQLNYIPIKNKIQTQHCVIVRPGLYIIYILSFYAYISLHAKLTPDPYFVSGFTAADGLFDLNMLLNFAIL